MIARNLPPKPSYSVRVFLYKESDSSWRVETPDCKIYDILNGPFGWGISAPSPQECIDMMADLLESRAKFCAVPPDAFTPWDAFNTSADEAKEYMRRFHERANNQKRDFVELDLAKANLKLEWDPKVPPIALKVFGDRSAWPAEALAPPAHAAKIDDQRKDKPPQIGG